MTDTSGGCHDLSLHRASCRTFFTLPPSLSSLLLCSHMLCLCDRPTCQAWLTPERQGWRWFISSEIWGAGGNNTEWHYLFIKSKAAFLGRVEMWRLDTTPSLAPHTHTHFLIVPWLEGLASRLTSSKGMFLKSDRAESRRGGKNKDWEEAMQLNCQWRRFNPATQFGDQFIKNVFCLN